eukprot:SAG22_NODE_1239_length_5047_cov_3.281326_3_plen_90_part_00
MFDSCSLLILRHRHRLQDYFDSGWDFASGRFHGDQAGLTHLNLTAYHEGANASIALLHSCFKLCSVFPQLTACCRMPTTCALQTLRPAS